MTHVIVEADLGGLFSPVLIQRIRDVSETPKQPLKSFGRKFIFCTVERNAGVPEVVIVTETSVSFRIQSLASRAVEQKDQILLSMVISKTASTASTAPVLKR